MVIYQASLIVVTEQSMRLFFLGNFFCISIIRRLALCR